MSSMYLYLVQYSEFIITLVSKLSVYIANKNFLNLHLRFFFITRLIYKDDGGIYNHAWLKEYFNII